MEAAWSSKMIIGRRTFLADLVMVGTTSVLANLFLLPSMHISDAALLPNSPSPQLDLGETDISSVVFKIHGWNRGDAIAVDGSTASDPATNVAKDYPVWINVNQSWRTAWR
jgi:hypothetical protein